MKIIFWNQMKKKKYVLLFSILIGFNLAVISKGGIDLFTLCCAITSIGVAGLGLSVLFYDMWWGNE